MLIFTHLIGYSCYKSLYSQSFMRVMYQSWCIMHVDTFLASSTWTISAIQYNRIFTDYTSGLPLFTFLHFPLFYSVNFILIKSNEVFWCFVHQDKYIIYYFFWLNGSILLCIVSPTQTDVFSSVDAVLSMSVWYERGCLW